MTELFSNLGQTSINQIGGIGATDTTVVVANLNGTNPANAFPSSGNFRVVFGNDLSSEIAICTAVNSTTNTFTIIRGQEGTTAQSWVNGTPVALILTAQSINQMRADVWSVGPYASRPPQGLPTGSYYQATDGHTPWIWESNIGQWRPVINGVLGLQPPIASTFSGGTAVNSPNTIVDTGKGALDFTNPSGDAVNTTIFHGFTFNLTSPTGGFIETLIQHHTNLTSTANAWQVFGPCLRESSTGKIYALSHGTGLVVGIASAAYSHDYMEVDTYSSPTVRTTALAYAVSAINSPLFLRIRWDAQNIFAEFSRDRIIWITIQTNTISGSFTSRPDQIGFGGFSAGFAGKCRILHYTYGINPIIPDGVFTPNLNNLRPQVLAPIPVPLHTGWVSPIINR